MSESVESAALHWFESWPKSVRELGKALRVVEQGSVEKAPDFLGNCFT